MGPDSDANGNLCVMCREVASNSCSGCHSIRYCSTACQKIDWPVHKLLCKDFKDFKDDSRPTKEGCLFARAIYLPEDGPRPRFVWLPITESSTKKDFAAFDVSLFGNPLDFQRTSSILHNPILYRDLVRAVHFDAKPAVQNNNCTRAFGNPNQSLADIGNDLVEEFSGPILITCSTTKEAPSWQKVFLDVELGDFRYFVDALRCLQYDAIRYRQKKLPGEKVEGLRLNCAGDYYISPCTKHRTSVESVMLPRAMCDASSEVSIDIADAVGIPLVVTKDLPSMAWHDRETIHGLPCRMNPEAAFLADPLFEIPLAGDLLPLLLLDSRSEVGTWTVVRKDGKPLKLEMIRGLATYLLGKIRQIKSNAGDGSKEWLQHVLAASSKEDFQNWFATCTPNLSSAFDD